MKKLTITRGDASYNTRGLDNTVEREQAIQQEATVFIQAVIKELDSKSQAQHIAKEIIIVSAAIHSDLERILRKHGKREAVSDDA